MNKKLMLSLVVWIVVTLTACTTSTTFTAGPKVPMTGQNGAIVSKVYAAKLYKFDSVYIEGPFHVSILTHQPSQSIQVIGNRITTDMLYVEVNHQTLYLHMRPEWLAQNKGNLLIKIAVPDLKNMHYSGSGNVNIEGFASLRNLYFNGNGTVSMYWINSPLVNVQAAGDGRLFLAGIAKTLNMVLSDSIYADAKYLRSEKGFINTTDKARADVSVSRSLNALASGSSNIYYFRQPELLGQYMRESGSVLNMVGLKP